MKENDWNWKLGFSNDGFPTAGWEKRARDLACEQALLAACAFISYYQMASRTLFPAAPHCWDLQEGSAMPDAATPVIGRYELPPSLVQGQPLSDPLRGTLSQESLQEVLFGGFFSCSYATRLLEMLRFSPCFSG